MNPLKTSPLVWTILALMSPPAGSDLIAQSPLPTAQAHDVGIDPRRLERVEHFVERTVYGAQRAGAASLVARDGKVVQWTTYGAASIDGGQPLRRDTIFRIYSMSKVITSVAVLQLFESGALSLDDDITRWLPELAELPVFVGGDADHPITQPTAEPITVRRLLNHTAGFSYDIFTGSPVHELYRRADLWSAPDFDTFLERVATLPLIAEPGSAYNYSIAIDLLGAFIERASGQPFDAYLQAQIFDPLKMVDTGFSVPESKRTRLASLYELDPDGHLVQAAPILNVTPEPGSGIPSGGGGLFSTMGDYLRFAQALLNGGVLDGERVLGRKTVELALRNSLDETPTPYNSFSPADGWGLWSAVRLDTAKAREPGSDGMFHWSGAASTHFFVDPQEKLIGMFFSQHFPFDQFDLFQRFRIAVYQALE